MKQANFNIISKSSKQKNSMIKAKKLQENENNKIKHFFPEKMKHRLPKKESFQNYHHKYKNL